MGDDLVKRLRDHIAVSFDDRGHVFEDEVLCDDAADRIEELEAENKLLNEQMTAIEEMGTESLNALPDCLMRLAPALVENDDLKAKLAKAVDVIDWALICWDDHQEHGYNMQGDWVQDARTTLAELKGQDDE